MFDNLINAMQETMRLLDAEVAELDLPVADNNTEVPADILDILGRMKEVLQ